MKRGLPVSVESLLRRSPVETLRLAFMATWDEQCGESALRTMCAFANDLANVGGGYVLIGVEEERGVPVLPPRGLPEAKIGSFMEQIQGQAKRIEPRYMPIVVPEQVEGRWVIAVWCRAGDGRPYEAPERWEPRSRKRAYVRTGNATVLAEGELRRQLDEVSARVPFDDRVAENTSVDELSSALVHEFLREAGSRLASERHEPTALYRNLNLLKGQNGHAAPRNVALLFFAQEPRRWFSGAYIEIVQFPEGRSRAKLIERTIDGPLPSQLRTALETLRGLNPVEIRKHPNRAEADHIEAWPFAAVEEALVNAVHHRGYDNPEPTKVEILPESLRIVSYPGPVAGLRPEHLDAATPPLTPGRNRRIAELLKDLNLAEARGTGLGTIRKAMADNGSPPPRFSFDEERTYFEVFLPIHPFFLEKSTIAQPLRLGRPAPAEEVVGRAELVERVGRALAHQSVLLVGPRGRGVSSVMNAIAASIEGPCFQLDLRGITLQGLGDALGSWLDARVANPQEQGQRRARVAVAETLSDLLARAGRSRCTLLLDHLDYFGHPDDINGNEFDGFVHYFLEQRDGLHVVVAAHTPGSAYGKWSQHFDVIHVPPISEAHTAQLARRLLLGVGLDTDESVVMALVHASAGQPEVLVRLVKMLDVRRHAAPEAVAEALDGLLANPGDPTGLAGRSDHLAGMRSGSTPAIQAVLDVVAAQSDGLARNDLIARAVNAQRTRMVVLRALRELEDYGWLVEVDGVLRFEHPILRDEWIAGSRQGAIPYGGPDDVPF